MESEGSEEEDVYNLDVGSSSDEEEEEEDEANASGEEEEDSEDASSQEGGPEDASASDSPSHLMSDDDEYSDSDAADGEERARAVDTAWGRNKAAYYSGDTADLEIGQDFEEAKEEAEIANRMQRAKRAAADEADFLIDAPTAGGSSFAQ